MEGDFISNVFPYFWLTVIAFVGLSNLIAGIYELRRGRTYSIMHPLSHSKEEEPFYFWMNVAGRFAMFAMGCFMFAMGLGFFAEDLATWS